ncbi:MAG: putative metal-binding motif-containing protein, partial [Deltaproteobacteria bacterium]|nr:putative metal-binding motif-containing protein [Deltaproteobacteria bacterium]
MGPLADDFPSRLLDPPPGPGASMTRSFLLNAALIATGLSFAAVGCDDCKPDDTGSDKDIDDDGYIAEEYGGDDCDDGDPSIHPGADEVCDGKDNDCDKLVDDADDSLDLSTTSTWYADADGDGYGRPEDSTQACARPEGYVADDTDCDDTNPSYHPGGLDWLNNDIDEDCGGADATEAWDLEDAPYSVVGRIAREFLGYGMTTCDLDGDEYDDLIVTAPDGNDFHGEIGVFYGSNSSSWSTGMAITDADVYITDRGYLIGDVVACTDVDGDGHLDLVATRSECDYPSIFVESFGIVGWYGSEDDWSPTPGAPDFELSYDLGI